MRSKLMPWGKEPRRPRYIQEAEDMLAAEGGEEDHSPTGGSGANAHPFKYSLNADEDDQPLS